MNARTRRRQVRRSGNTHRPAFALDRWREANEIRAEWARYGLSTTPADRDTAEAAITGLYRLIGRPAPRFTWADSPWQATEFLPADAPPVRLWAADAFDGTSHWSVALQLATLVHQLRAALDQRIGRPFRPSWPSRDHRLAGSRSPVAALEFGIGLDTVLEVGVRESLERSVADAVRAPLRAALAAPGGEPAGIRWYGQHDVHWVAHYDVRRRLGMRTFAAADNHQLDLWADTARSCGWWWPMEGWCVVTERTAVVHTEATPGARHGEVRAHNARGMAVAYPDGTGAHAWHGTPVPEWVITEPTVERILAERNVEVRRSAIERIGWDTYIAQAGLRMVATAPDPGNPGCELELYDLPDRVWGAPAQVLLAVNGSIERDGHRRRYGLSVPADIDDPVAAAGWSYGLSGTQYAGLLRRT